MTRSDDCVFYFDAFTKAERGVSITLPPGVIAAISRRVIRIIPNLVSVKVKRNEPGGRASVCAEAVSNRIEQLVVDGKITEAQAANLHRLAQDVYDGVVERLEAKVIEDALAATNTVESVTEGE